MEKIINGVYRDEHTYYIDGKEIVWLYNVSKYLYTDIYKSTSNELWEYAIKKRRYIDLVSKELGYCIENVIPRKFISYWLTYLSFYEDFKYLCSNYDKICGTEYLFWFFERYFISIVDLDSSFGISYGKMRKKKKNTSYVQLYKEFGFRSTEIKNSTLCTYKGKKYATKSQLREELGIARNKISQYQKVGTLSKMQWNFV